MKETQVHETIPGRKAAYVVPNYLADGQHLAHTKVSTVIRGEAQDAAEGWEDVDEDNDEDEVDETGDLDLD